MDPLAEAACLFNAKQYYARHDALEEEWAGARGPKRTALKALIFVAAGMHHLRTSSFPGARSLLSQGLRLIEEVPLPVDSDGLLEPVRSALAKTERILAGESVAFGNEDLPRLRLTRSDADAINSAGNP